MTDPGIEARIERLKTALKRLQAIRQLGSTKFRRQPFAQDSAERNLHRVIEAPIDLGNYIIKRRGLETPQTYTDIPRILASRRILAGRFEAPFVEMVGLRNLLVHDYASIDSHRIFRFITDGRNLLKEMGKRLIEAVEKQGAR